MGQKQAPTSSDMVATDLESRPFWIFDFQETIPLQFEVVANENTGESILEKGTEIVPGDKFQVTCVYDSTDRTENTKFDLSTYDEMCFNSLKVTFATPEAWKNESTTAEDSIVNTLDINTQLHLMSFGCKAGSEYSLYTGTLAEGEEDETFGRTIPLVRPRDVLFRSTQSSHYSLIQKPPLRPTVLWAMMLPLT